MKRYTGRMINTLSISPIYDKPRTDPVWYNQATRRGKKAYIKNRKRK